MTSESTRFLGQPSETKPTAGRTLAASDTGSEGALSDVLEGSRTEDGTPPFYGRSAVSGVLYGGTLQATKAN